MIILNLSCSNIDNSLLSKNNYENPLIVKLNHPIDFSRIKAYHILESANIALIKSQNIRNDIIKIPDSLRTFDNTILPLDDIYNTISRIWNPIELLASTSPNMQIIEACDKASILFSSFYINLSNDYDIFNSIVQYKKYNDIYALPNYKRKFILDELREFIKGGVKLSKEDQAKLKQIQNQITVLSIEFSNNINRSSDTLYVDYENMYGMSSEYLDQRLYKNKLYFIDLSYASVDPFMSFAESDSIRKELRFHYLNRGMPNNIHLLDKILVLRNEYAKILGYSSFNDYIIEDNMAKSTQDVFDFEYQLLEKVRLKAIDETNQLLYLKRKFNKNSDSLIYDWEKFYYENQLLLDRYKLDNNEIKKYFEINNVIKGLFYISQKLFDIEFKKVYKPSVWHFDVEMYEVYDVKTKSKIGSFYLDLYPRENKYPHAAEYTIYNRKRLGSVYQLPVVCLVCNFSKSNSISPSLLSHDEVITFFHEFGHLLHDLLSETELSTQSGTSVAMDFVEAPSQMLENWAWEKESLKYFAKHYITGNIIPDSLVDKMIQAKNVQVGNDVQQQIFYGLIDLKLHNDFVPNEFNKSIDLVINLQNEITNYFHMEGTNLLASFDHLIDYSSSYYGYLWSEVYAADMFSVFKLNGIMNPEIGRKFRESILSSGGSEDPIVLVETFLGRKASSDAFISNLNLEK